MNPQYVLYLSCNCCIAKGSFTYDAAKKFAQGPEWSAYCNARIYDVINEEFVG